MVYDSVGEDSLRAENISRIIQGVADMEFKLKQCVMTPRSSSWSESYYRENSTALTPVAGIPRLAAFPHDFVSWEKNTAFMLKHGLETTISWEDAVSNNMDVIQRSALRLGSAVAKSVDDAIWAALLAGAGNAVAVDAGQTWNHATRSARIPHEHIGLAKAKLSDGVTTNFRADKLLLNTTDEIYFTTNDYILDAFKDGGANVLTNGSIGRFLGMDVIVSPAVASDTAMVLQSKMCGTYRMLSPLKVARKLDEGIGYTIRAWEVGVPFVTTPDAICKITNTNT